MTALKKPDELFRIEAIREEIALFTQFLFKIELPEEYVVIGGANLVLRGIKPETRDIDMLVSQDVFNVLQAHPKTKTKEPPAQAKIRGATNLSVVPEFGWSRVPMSLTVSMGDGWFPMHYDQYRNEKPVNIFGGVKMVPLDDVWDSKVAIQRPSDRDDLLLIAQATSRDLSEVPQPKYMWSNFPS